MSSSLSSQFAGKSFSDDPNNIIDVVQVIFYVATLIFSAVILFFQGRSNAKGWVSISIFALLSVVGNSINIDVAVTSQTKVPSVGLITAGLVMSSISLGPLESAALEFLTRGAEVGHLNNPASSGPVTTRWKRIINLVILGATILSLVGTIEVSNGSSSTGKILVKISSVLFVAGFLLIAALAVICRAQIGVRYDTGYINYIYAVFVSVPFFIVRLVFTVVASFSMTGDLTAYHKFSIFNGEWQIRLGMMVCMQFAITIIYCFAGYTTELVANRGKREINETETWQKHYAEQT
jgi:hypothetical protein